MRNLRIVVTDYCNLNCSYCYNEGNSKHSPITHEIDYISLHNVIPFLVRFFDDIIITGGEPMLHPQIEQILQSFITERKVPRITTNGTLLEKLIDTNVYNHIQRFNISIDKFDPKSFRLRTTTKAIDYYKIIESIKRLVLDKKDVSLNVICDESIGSKEIEDIFFNMQLLGVNQIKFIPVIGCDERFVIHSILKNLDGGIFISQKLGIIEYLYSGLSVKIVQQYCNMKKCDRCKDESFYRLNYDGKIYKCLKDKSNFFDLFNNYKNSDLIEKYLQFARNVE